jgi:2',3'-cyclic-nucleotide 2'-phosphodiesterase (5'-nucleotidase family)
MKKLTLVAAGLVAVLLAAVGTSAVAKPAPPPPVMIQILNVSDWHGNVDPLASIGGAWTSRRAGSRIGSLSHADAYRRRRLRRDAGALELL